MPDADEHQALIEQREALLDQLEDLIFAAPPEAFAALSRAPGGEADRTLAEALTEMQSRFEETVAGHETFEDELRLRIRDLEERLEAAQGDKTEASHGTASDPESDPAVAAELRERIAELEGLLSEAWTALQDAGVDSAGSADERDATAEEPRVAELERELELSEGERDVLREELRALRAQLDTSRSKTRRLDGVRKRQAELLRERDDALSESRRRIETLETSRFEEIDPEEADAGREAESGESADRNAELVAILREELADKEERLGALAAAHNDLAERCAEQSQRLRDLRDVDSRVERIRELELEVGRLERAAAITESEAREATPEPTEDADHGDDRDAGEADDVVALRLRIADLEEELEELRDGASETTNDTTNETTNESPKDGEGETDWAVRVAELEAERQGLGHELAAARAELEVLRAEAAAVRQAARDADEEVAATEDSADDRDERLARLESELAGAVAARDRALEVARDEAAEVAELRARLEELQVRRADAETDEDMRAAAATARLRVDQLRERDLARQTEMAEHLARLERLVEENARLRERLARLADAEEENLRLREELADGGASEAAAVAPEAAPAGADAGRLAELEQRIEELEAGQEKLVEQKKTLMQSKARLATRARQATEAREDFEQRFRGREARLAALESELEEARQALEEERQRALQLQNRTGALADENRRLRGGGGSLPPPRRGGV